MLNAKAHRRRVLQGLVCALAISPVMGAPGLKAEDNPNDWPQYHRTDAGLRYSPLDKITKANISKLKVAWMHQPGDIAQGLQATPLAIDGVLYYIAANNRVFALDAITGDQIWSFTPELDPIAAKSLFSFYNRGVTVGKGKVYFGSLDGRVFALDQKTGKKLWDTKLTDPKNCHGCNFTSPPTLAGDALVLGQTGGDLAQSGKIFAVNAETGKRTWTFDVISNDPKSWPAKAAPHGGGGAWLPGQYDEKYDQLIIGTTNAAPDFDGSERKGDNLYTATILALDPKTGKLRWHHQEVPHDVWDYDAAYESVMVEKDGKDLLFHLNKGGFVTVLDRKDGSVVNVWPLSHNINWVKSIDPKSGELIGRDEPELDKVKTFCPSVLGARSWNHGAYDPKRGLWFTNAHEFCQGVQVGKTEPKDVPFSAPFFNFSKLEFVPPPGGKATSRLQAVDPFTGKTAWTVDSPMPNLGSVLATAGDLVFNGDVRGYVRAYASDTGEEVWKFNVGSGIRSGIMTYSAGGKQYIVVPAGFGSLFPAFAGGIFPEFKGARGGAVLVAFTLE